MDNTAILIGNVKSKETHKLDCYCLRMMKEENKVTFTSLKQAVSQGYDTCGHCFAVPVPVEINKSPDNDYIGYFCVDYNGKEHCNRGDTFIYGDLPREIVTLRAKLYSNDGSLQPVSNQVIKLTCFGDDVHEEVIIIAETNKNGVVEVEYNPINLESGETEFRAYFPDASCTSDGTDINYIKIYIRFMPSITNVRISPNPFERITTIMFDLLEDIEMDISIYRNAYFLRPLSRRKTLRDVQDGILKKGTDIQVVWDGTNDRGKQVWRGEYVVLLRTKKDFVFKTGLIKTKGKFGK
jgi:hypothetical protein